MSASRKFNLLIAYPYFTPSHAAVVQEMGENVRLLIDSGAFTAWKANKIIHLDEYCRFIEELPVKPWRYFTLDVVGDPDGTRRNYEEMLRRGFAPIPIHTRGESLSDFDRYCATSDLVAIGGLVGGGEKARRHVKAILEYAGDRHVHLLGFTAFNWMKHFKPFSADSSNWEGGARYGTVSVYAGHGRFHLLGRETAHLRAPPKDVMKCIAALGFDPYKLQKSENWRGDNGIARWITAASWIAASMDLEANVGTKLFLSISANRADLLRDCFYGLTGRLHLDSARDALLRRNVTRGAAA